MITYGSDFPAADYLADEAVRLAKQFGKTPYQLGTSENDASLKKETCLSQKCTVYFRDGSIMQVRIPAQVIRKNGMVVPVKGLIEYSMIQTRMKNEMDDHLIGKEEYQHLYL